jgi:acyl carrier protein
MCARKTLEILHSIAEYSLGITLSTSDPLVDQIKEDEWAEVLSSALGQELEAEVTASEIESASSMRMLSELLETRLIREPRGRSIVDTYAVLEQFVREEISNDADYHWYAAWIDDLLKATESLEDVEILLRMEDAFGFSISDRDAQNMRTVGQTVRYLWR